MSMRKRAFCVALFVGVFVLAVCMPKTEARAASAGEGKAELVFSDVEVECTNRDGLFGGRYANFKVSGSVKNASENPVNEDNMPKLVSKDDEDIEFKADLTQDKLLPGETCDVTYSEEFDVKHDELPALSFSGKLSFVGLDDAEKELNDGLKKVVDKYAAQDAEKDAKKEKEKKAEAKSKKKQKKDKKALKACKGKTAAEAWKVAKKTDYKPSFKDSYDVDVTDGVKEGAEPSSAKVTKVEVKDAGFLSSSKVTFKLDYVDPAAKEERDEKSSDGEDVEAVDYASMAIGQAVDLENGLSLTVNSVEPFVSEYGSEDPTVCVNVTYVNNGDSNESFNSFNWKVVDANGVETDQTFVLDGENELSSGNLQPGGTVSGNVYFEGSPVKVLYYSNVFDSEATIGWVVG